MGLIQFQTRPHKQFKQIGLMVAASERLVEKQFATVTGDLKPGSRVHKLSTCPTIFLYEQTRTELSLCYYCNKLSYSN